MLRAIRYGEADNVLALLTLERGRVSAIAKGAAARELAPRRAPAARACARTWGCTRAAATWPPCGRRASSSPTPASGSRATVCAPPAACWRAPCARCPSGSRNPAGLPPAGPHAGPAGRRPARARPAAPAPAGARAPRPSCIVVAGLLPRLGCCASCGSRAAPDRRSRRPPGAPCAAGCAGLGEPAEPADLAALAGLVEPPARPRRARPARPSAAPDVERLVGLVLREGLGVVLRSAAPL